MHILIYTDTKLSARKLKKRLSPLNARVEIKRLQEEPQWSGKYLDDFWVSNFTDNLNRETDCVMFVLEDWKSSKSTLLGHYRSNVGDYAVATVKHRDDWEDTAVHEIMHVVWHPIYVYMGTRLENIFKVSNWHRDIVHGEHPDYREYDYQDAMKRIAPMLKSAILKKRQMRKLVALKRYLILLRQYLDMLRSRTEEVLAPEHPFSGYDISQPYGRYNKRYSLTHRHIGVDYMTPKGTKLRAPIDGEVVASGYTNVLGNFAHFQYTHNGQQYTERYLHLASPPQKGHYSRGKIIGSTSNTGMADGYHAHIDIWKGDVDLTSINKTNWSKLTVNPEKHYVS